ncbi:MAG: D-alanyl-D-alanine carboxypeptidase family protein [Bacillota bacterium]|nr:D-alanyl-D-alanine carboxypeptidase family protein [Bacillota bacterium]
MAGFLALVGLLWPGPLGAEEAPSFATVPPPPAIEARSALLLDVETGTVLYAKNPDEPMPPASLTKIMTMYLALDDLAAGKITLGETVPVTPEAYALARNPNLSNMFLQPDLPVTVEQIFKGIMVSSGNDAATALAQFLAGGSEKAFVQRMNEKAASLNLRQTHFGDASGLAVDDQTTAADMARLSRQLLLDHPEILDYSAIKKFQYNIEYEQPNYNSLLFRDERVDGLKTGHIGGVYHLVATGSQGDLRLLAVVMGAKSMAQRADEAQALLDWGFNHFRLWNYRETVQVSLYKGRQREASIPVALTAVVPSGEEPAVTLTLPSYLVAPLPQGTQVGTVEASVGGASFQAPVLLNQDLERGSFLRVLWDSLKLALLRLFGRL